MASTQEDVIRPETTNLIDKIRAGPSNPSSPPAATPSGGQGAGSGSSGADNGSGGSPPGNSSGSSNNNSDKGGSMSGRTVQIVLLSILAVISTLCTIYATMWYTSDQGIARGRELDALSSQETGLKKEEERTRQMRIAERRERSARVAGTNPPAQQPVATPPISESSAGCINPADTVSHWSKPIMIGSGQCVKVPKGTQREFWVAFASTPTRISGDARIREAVGPEPIEKKLEKKKACLESGTDEATCDREAQKAHGIWADGGCNMDAYTTPDSCLRYLQGKKIGTPVHVYALDMEIQTK